MDRNDLIQHSETRTSSRRNFQEWKDSVRVYPGREVFAVGDPVTPLGLVGEEEAFWYYQKHIRTTSALTIHNGQTDAGTPINVSAFPPGSVLTYCIDRTALEEVAEFYDLPSGTDIYPYVDEAFGLAAATWNEVLDISIQKESGRDRTCSPTSGDSITWYVKPMALPDPLEYLTFVLHPNHNRSSPDNREFLVLDYLIQRAFPGAYVIPGEPDWDDMFSMAGLLLRAIGNGLGFVDESNRGGVPGDAGQNFWAASCRDSGVGGIFLSDADPYSVMTHPQNLAPVMDNPACAGLRERDYALSYVDVMAAACQYRNDNIFYYCSQHAQLSLAAQYPAHCSPYLLFQGGAGDCGANSNATLWKNESLARSYHAAVLAALS